MATATRFAESRISSNTCESLTSSSRLTRRRSPSKEVIIPSLPPITGMLKVLLTYSLPTVATVLNRLFFNGTGSTTNAALNTWATAVSTAWGTNVKTNINTSCALTGVVVSDLSSSTAPIGAWTGSIAGTSAGTGDSPAVALIVKNLIPSKYRGGHSRTYIPGYSLSATTVSDSNIWTSASATTFVTNWTAFITAITGGNGPTGYSGLAQAVPHYYKGFVSVQNPTTKRWRNIPQLVTAPVPYDLVSSRVANLTIGSQRRRNHQSP